MKKIFSILSAGLLGLMAVSCLPEQLAVFDPSNATAPVLGTVEVGAKNVSVNYTPGTFQLGFNESIAPTHTLALTSIDGKAVSRIISSKDDGATLTASIVNISRALAFFGYTDGQTINSLELVVRASIQDPSKDNGRNGFVDSEPYSISNFVVSLPQGSPYADYTEASSWSVIGALSNYDINWNGDLEMFATEDGTRFVAKAVTIKKDDQFKFRKDQAWDTNYGAPGDVEPYVLSVDTELTGAAGGKNLGVAADGIYDLWLDLSGSDAVITITDAYLPYPEHTQASTWSIIGALSNYDISWNGDLPMTTNGKTFVAQGIKLSKDDQFKFRKDQAWDTNFGAPGDVEPFVVTLGSESPAAAGGKNLAVPEDGIYDLILDADGQTYTIVETLGGGVSGKIGGDEPEPEPVGVTGWNVIGANGDWDNDIIATEQDGVWTAYINAPEATTFKWRKDGDWAENYGIAKEATYTVGTPFAAAAGGDDISLEAGFWKVVLDLTDEANPTITVSEGNVWSLIGDFNGWGADVDMFEIEPGVWVSPATALNTNGFKIRHNHDWTTSYGGAFTAIGVAFEATTTDGNNIMLEVEDNYVGTFNANDMTITVELALPANKWSVIGDFNGWNADSYMTEVAPGIWVSDELELTENGWKIRFNNSWDVNRGGATPTQAGEFVAAYPGGDDIKIGGKGRVVFNEMNQTIGLLGWGVVGKIASITGFEWNNDIPMNLASDGKWYSVPVTFSEGDEFKLRWMAEWGQDFGGNMDEIDKPFEKGGDNVKVSKAGTYMVVYDPEASTITLSTDFWSLIGAFSEWTTDRFMLPLGEGKWAAYNQEISGGWKIRKGADWTVSAGGTYTAAGEAFDGITDNGPDIAVTDLTRFDILYDTVAGKITVSAPVK